MFERDALEKQKVIAKNTRVTIFSVSSWSHYGYPYRLAHVGKVFPKLRESCYELMIDSDVSDPSVTNDDILADAAKYHADYIFPKDYAGKPEETLASLENFLSQYESHTDVHGKVVPVIQPDHARHLKAHKGFYDQFSHLALGGLHGFTPEEQVAIINDVRDVIGPHKHLHAFGVGTSLKLIRAIRNRDPFVDSLDCATAEKAVFNGGVVDRRGKQQPFDLPNGDGVSAIRGQFASSILLMLNYLVGPDVNTETLEQDYEESDLKTVQEMVTDTDVRSRHDIEWEDEFTDTDTGETPGSSERTTLASYA
ncbi:hypothetical protein RYH80_18250 [Halobaculum sp. MBLA0147]|uniref:hypothetical protein n=1 Tax=Halobaculum sp. MBLA0147 TaxID=3079934 RepID=UPI0035263808